MKHLRVWAVAGAFSLLVALALPALTGSQGAAEPVFSGGSFLTTITDTAGNFGSRSVITLHADHTMLAVDSGQQGPVFYFGSQLGNWKPAGGRQIIGRTMNFAYPQGPNGPGVVRTDYFIKLSPDRRHMTGTVTVTDFPLQEVNPYGEGGILVASANFEGERIEP